jgi:hypothetical protein
MGATVKVHWLYYTAAAARVPLTLAAWALTVNELEPVQGFVQQLGVYYPNAVCEKFTWR